MLTIKKSLVLFLALLLTLSLTTVVLGAGHHDRGYFGTDYDFGGETINIWSWYDIDDRFEEGEIAEGRIEEAEEAFNVNVEFRTDAGWDEITEVYMNRLLAGDSSNDVWLTQDGIAYFDLLAQGGLYPLDDILPDEYYDGLRERSQEIIDALSYEGTRYGFDTNYGMESDFLARDIRIIYYNKEMIEQEGLPDPYDLYKEGDWTWETFTDMARDLTKDTDGDDEVDQYAIQRNPWWDFTWYAANNGKFVQEEDGRLVVTMDLPENRETAMQLREWHTVEEISGPGFQDGRVAFMPLMMFNSSNYMDNLDFDFGFVPPPKGPSADEHILHSHALETWAVPVNSENPEAKVALTEFLFWDDDEAANEAIQGQLQDSFPEQKYAELAVELTKQWDSSSYNITVGGVGNTIQEGLHSVVDGEQDFSTIVDEIEPEAQAKLDDFFDQ